MTRRKAIRPCICSFHERNVDHRQLCLGIVRLIAQNSLLRFERGRAIARDLLRMLFGILCCFVVAGSAAALDPTRSIAQMRHSRWTLGDGAPGNIRAIVQGRDGYLWLGTATGLYRFDGIVFERIVPVDQDRYRSPQVTALLAARNGDIWVGYDFGGVAVFRGGVLKGANPAPPVGGVNRIVEGRDGAIWFAVESKGKLVLSRLSHGHWSWFGPGQGVSDTDIGDILSTSEGIYLSARPKMLLLRTGASRFNDTGISVEDYTALAESPGGRLWLWASDKIRSVSNTRPMYRTGPVTTPYVFPRPAFDHDGNLWLLGQDAGLGRLSAASLDQSDHPGAVEMFTERQGLTASLTLSMLEDREGNIWVGTESGAQRGTSLRFRWTCRRKHLHRRAVRRVPHWRRRQARADLREVGHRRAVRGWSSRAGRQHAGQMDARHRPIGQACQGHADPRPAIDDLCDRREERILDRDGPRLPRRRR
jgi:hypothetical protein